MEMSETQNLCIYKEKNRFRQLLFKIYGWSERTVYRKVKCLLEEHGLELNRKQHFNKKEFELIKEEFLLDIPIS